MLKPLIIIFLLITSGCSVKFSEKWHKFIHSSEQGLEDSEDVEIHFAPGPEKKLMSKVKELIRR